MAEIKRMRVRTSGSNSAGPSPVLHTTKPKPKKHSLFSKKPKKRKTEKDGRKQATANHISGYKTVTQQRLADEANKQSGLLKLNRTLLMREKLHGVARWIGDNELDMLVKMDTSLGSIQRRMKNRVLLSGSVLVIATVFALILHNKFSAAIVGAAFLLGAGLWIMDSRKTTNYYREYRLERQIAFSQFTRLAAAYLPELAQGANLYSLFKKILPRMDNKRDHASLETLMIDMQVDPDDPGPFMAFAHEFSASDSAEMIMGTIQQMYQGNVDDHNIRALADLANRDMLRQIDDVITYKIKKFNNLTTRVAMCSMIVIFGFFGLLMVNTFINVFHSVMDNTQNIYGDQGKK